MPTYRVDPIANFEVTTQPLGASDAGHLVGYQVIDGVSHPFVATLDEGLVILPLPEGAMAGLAMDVNSDGTVVGTISGNGFAWDSGAPAFWIRGTDGTYQPQLLDYPATVPALGQQMATSGGQVTAINDAGQMVGFVRIQGFMGGPSLLFSPTEDPINLRELGFQATATDLNNQGKVVGGGLMMDLATGEVTDLGIPAPHGGTPFTNVLAYAINNRDEVVAAADLASTVFENYLTYRFNGDDGWQPVNPAQLPSRYVGFYDNNDLGDISASGGVLFQDENVLVSGYASLLEPSFSSWEPSLGFIDNSRRVATTAISGNQNALVLLSPLTFGDADLDGQVNSGDLLQISDSYGLSGTVWAGGDFDRSGATEFNDLLLMAEHYDDPTPLAGLELAPALISDWLDALALQGLSAVPEAGSFQISAYPNPFNPRTVIHLSGLQGPAQGLVQVFDLRGRLVRTLHQGPILSPEFTWDGEDNSGNRVAAGPYVVVGTANGEAQVTKVTLVK
nr:FlgD immunoglobulin-like domain containing protein [Candidatus Krumholzibacteria bacterium]